MSDTVAATLIAKASSRLSGQADIPGDKSVSHRSLILGGMAIGTTRVTGLLEGEDVLSTLNAMRGLGAKIDRPAPGEAVIEGVGMHGFVAPAEPLDLGNAGTGVRLLMGAVAGQDIEVVFVGDASLSKRPMRRITDPLKLMGAGISDRDGMLPVTITGSATPLSVQYDSPVASAQIKSAVLLAGLNARGQTVVTEPAISRDHTESMLRHFGAQVRQETDPDTGRHIVTLDGEASLVAADIAVPRDPSSAAFAIVAALITKGSDITLPGIAMNPQRTGLFTTLIEMGGDIRFENERLEGGESVADIRVISSDLKGVEVPAERAVSMIDEYPILSIAAAMAQGQTHMTGVAELRVKETDRIAVMAEGLRRNGISADETQDSLTITGIGSTDKTIPGGLSIDSCHDHRIAMSFLTLGLVADAAITVEGAETIATSFPQFTSLMRALGADISEPQ